MDFVNSISGTFAAHKSNLSSTTHAAAHSDALAGSQPSESAQQGALANMRSANDVNNSLMDMLKATLGEAESYLAVFEARVKLEEEYVRGLKVLSEKSRDGVARLDAKIASSLSFEPGSIELPKARLTWKEVLDNHLREIDARSHYIETLRQGVIAPLIAYRDGQERIRKRVKDDLKTSIAAYEEMRSHTLPRARKMYEKRCEEVEQLRLQQVAIEEQKLLLSSTGMHRDGSQSSHTAGAPSAQQDDFRHLSPPSSTFQSDVEEDHARSEVESQQATGVQRSPSQRHSRKESKHLGVRGAGSDSSGADGLQSISSNTSPRIGGEAALSTSPSSGEKKGHFFDALRSRETWETARKEGPKKLNALLNRMREGTSGDRGGEGQMQQSINAEGSSNVGQGGLGVSLGRSSGSMKSNQTLALKNVKAKREADEADKVYRKAVFDLETLRMRRQKTIAAAKTSVIEARRELYLTCQAVWLQAEQSVQVLANVQLSLSMHAEDVLRGTVGDLDKELKRLEAKIPAVEEEHVPYRNYYFGETKSLLFGVSLVDYAFSRAQHAPPHLGPPKAEAPIIVQKCIRFIEERALDQPGIYRTSAKHSAIQNLAHAVERDEERFAFSATDDEPSTVAGVLKLYLRQLPEPVLPMPWEERVRYTHERQEQIQTGFASLKGRIRRLPAINQATLRALVEHLAKVASHAEQNKMNASNLSIIFGPLLLSQLEHDATSIAAAMEEDRVTEDMILYADTIFDLTRAGAPVLPFLASASSTAEPSWDLNSVDQQVERTQDNHSVGQQQQQQQQEQQHELPASAKSIETIVPTGKNSEPVYFEVDAPLSTTMTSTVPQSAEGAYLPPTSPQSNEGTAQEAGVEEKAPESKRASGTLPALDVNAPPAKREGRFDENIDAKYNSTAPDTGVAQASNPTHLVTPTDFATSTPITAVSSANASLGHGLDHASGE